MTRRHFALAGAATVAAGASSQENPAAGPGILALDRSPFARLKNVPVPAVKLLDGFWTPRRRVNVESSIPTMLQLLEEHGIVDNFRRLSKKKQVARKGPLYTDSDLYKWMEGAAFVLQNGEAPHLRATFDSLVDDILAAQEPSGYLNTYFVEERASRRWKEQVSGHELYCLGHLLQAALAYQRAGGSTKLLEGGIRFVEHLIRDFGPGKQALLTGHPELEMALVELYRTTGDKRQLDLAGYLLHGDGERLGVKASQYEYMFSGKPFTSRTQLEGHAVRAMYACCGATDYYLETGDTAYRRTLSALWDDLLRGKMYLTGGVGSRSSGEAFGEAYELPNQLAYTESCAAIANMMWNWRMLAATADARHADVMERALYNGVNSGMSLSGNQYCYRNPLAYSGNPEDKIRNPWYETTCCPPNLQRTLASLPGYMYSAAHDGVYVHLYHASEANLNGLKLRQNTDYPWDGRIEIEVTPQRLSEFTVYLRIPGWAESAQVLVNGSKVNEPRQPGTYLALRRTWQAGDFIVLSLDMTPRWVTSNRRVADNLGRVAIERGPLVYCLEGLDQAGADIYDVAVDPNSPMTPEIRTGLLGGVTVLRHVGAVVDEPSVKAPLYSTLRSRKPRRRAELTFIPYYAFANRAITPMMVWVPLV